MRIVFGLALIGAACAFACGSSSSGSPGGTGGSDSGGGADGKAGGSASRAGTGNSPGNAGTSSDAGSGGEAGAVELPPVVSSANPHAAGGLVAGAVVAHSAHFTGIFSLGAAPGGNGLSTSATHQLRGGVVGASQK